MRIPASHAGAPHLYGPEFASRPAEIYRQMRSQYGPVAPVLLESDIPAWLVIGYRELYEVTTSPRVFARSSHRWNMWGEVPDDWPHRPMTVPSPGWAYLDDPEHSRRLNAVSDALDSIDRVDFRKTCIGVLDGLIDEFSGKGEADLIAQYTQRIPTRVMARFYGLAAEAAEALAEDIVLITMQGPEAIDAQQRFLAALVEHVAGLRDRPGKDIAHYLMNHPVGLTEEQLIWDLGTLLVTDQDPTACWIGNTLRLMLIDDQFSLTLQGGRLSAEEALNEVLWKDAPVQNVIGRFTTQDCELAGQRIGKGDMVILGLAAANADPAAYPAGFASVGHNHAHMAYGHGPNACVGRELGRIMATTAIEVLLDRVPDIGLAIAPEDLRWRPSVWFRSLEALPVAFTPMTPLRQSSRQR